MASAPKTGLEDFFLFGVRWIFALEQTSHKGVLREMRHAMIPRLGLLKRVLRLGITDLVNSNITGNFLQTVGTS